MLLKHDLKTQNYQQRTLRAFERRTFVPLVMFMRNFVTSGKALSKSCGIFEEDTYPNLLFSAILPEQNLNFAPKCFNTLTLGALLSKTLVIR